MPLADGWFRNPKPLHPQHYLTLILMALVEQCGEIRIDACSLELLDSSARLITDWDIEKQQLVITVASRGQFIFEVPQWPAAQQPAMTAPSSRGSSTHKVMTDEEARRLIQEKAKREAMRQWREQGAEAVAAMPEPFSPESGGSSTG